MQRHSKRLAPILLVLMLAGCAAKNPNTVPTPPPIQVANSVNMLAQTLDAATTGLIAARDGGQLSQEDLTTAFKIVTRLVAVGKEINVELRSPNTWPVQKTKILSAIVTAGLPALSAQLSPNAKIILQASLALFNEISQGVGGPSVS